MRCKHCGGRTFGVTTRAFQTIQYDMYDEIIHTKDLEVGDIIEEEGYTCQTCGKELNINDVIQEKKGE